MRARSSCFPRGAAITLAALRHDPYPIYAELQRHEPITWAPALNMWLVVRHDDVSTLLFDHKHLATSSTQSTIFDTFGKQMLTTEGEDHLRYRTAARPAFTPKSVREQLEGQIEHLVDQLIDGFMRSGRVELREQFASRLPVQVMLKLFGLPQGDEALLRRWFDCFETALANFGWDPEVRAEAQGAGEAFRAYLRTATAEKARKPDESLLSQLVHAADAGSLSTDEIIRNASIIMFGGISTVEALTLNLVWSLLSHPTLQASVTAEPHLIAPALEETIRWLSPVQSATRHVVSDFVYNDVAFEAGETVNCMLGAANRDAAVFVDPNVFDLERKSYPRHLGFAQGPHHCLGMHLAKAEAGVAARQLLARLPGLALNADELSAPEGHEFRQPRALAVTWNAGAAQGTI